MGTGIQSSAGTGQASGGSGSPGTLDKLGSFLFLIVRTLKASLGGETAQDSTETLIQVDLRLERPLGRFWFGAKLAASWDQVGTRIGKTGVPRRCQKIIENPVTQWYAGVRK